METNGGLAITSIPGHLFDSFPEKWTLDAALHLQPRHIDEVVEAATLFGQLSSSTNDYFVIKTREEWENYRTQLSLNSVSLHRNQPERWNGFPDIDFGKYHLVVIQGGSNNYKSTHFSNVSVRRSGPDIRIHVDREFLDPSKDLDTVSGVPKNDLLIIRVPSNYGNVIMEYVTHD